MAPSSNVLQGDPRTPRVFQHAFPLAASNGLPAVKWKDTRNHRPSDSFGSQETYGLATGRLNGFWVLDLDRKNGKDGLKSLMEHADGRELPDTYTVSTKSGGLHLYFTWTDGVPVRNKEGLLLGVDVRGEGGLVRAGASYPVLLDEAIVAAPQWLLELVLPVRAAPETTVQRASAISPEHPEWSNRLAQAKRFLISEPPCVSGQGGQAQLWKIALRVMRTYELPVDAALELLTAYNLRCAPPWEQHEVIRTLLRAAEHGQGPTGTFAGSFLAPLHASAGVVHGAEEFPSFPESKAWLQRADPHHKYSCDLASMCAGALQKSMILGPKELTGAFAGPGAPPPWVGVWQYDTFRRRVQAVNPPFALDAETAGISRRDLASIQVWVSCNGGKASLEAIDNAISVAAHQASFHPVQQYLDSIAKMSEEEAREYFKGIAGRLWAADPDREELESGHLMRFAIAAVRRIRVPGAKVDTMLVLAGEQGLRKSLLCEKLFGEFFLDQLPPIQAGRGHEASIALEGRWGIEIAEMNALAGAGESAKKEFVSRCVDKYRPVFGIAMQEVPRQCVFIGTTNLDNFLEDPTGETRYDVCDVREAIDLDTLDRDVFWSAAVALESAGVPHWRDRAMLARCAADGAAPNWNASFAAEDPWTGTIVKYVAGMPHKRYILAVECITYALLIPIEKQDKHVMNRVQAILRKQYGASKVVNLEGRSQRAYVVNNV